MSLLKVYDLWLFSSPGPLATELYSTFSRYAVCLRGNIEPLLNLPVRATRRGRQRRLASIIRSIGSSSGHGVNTPQYRNSRTALMQAQLVLGIETWKEKRRKKKMWRLAKTKQPKYFKFTVINKSQHWEKFVWTDFITRAEECLFIAHLQDMETWEAAWSRDETICSAPLPYWDLHGPGCWPLEEAFVLTWQDPKWPRKRGMHVSRKARGGRGLREW